MKIDKNLIELNQKFISKEEAIKAAGQILLKNGKIEEEYIHGMLEREQSVSTYMGNYLAIPHGVNDSRKYVKETGISFLQVPNGVSFGENQEVKIIIGIASKNNEHLEILQNIAIFASEVSNVEKLINTSSEEKIIEILEGMAD